MENPRHRARLRQMRICAAPHTTNFDLFIGKLFYGALGRKTSFMMKKEWFFFPVGIFFKAAGAFRRPRTKDFAGGPDGESLRQKAGSFIWPLPLKEPASRTPTGKGFYYIALKAQVLIVLIGID